MEELDYCFPPNFSLQKRSRTLKLFSISVVKIKLEEGGGGTMWAIAGEVI